jgi:anti-sigma factor RsiW
MFSDDLISAYLDDELSAEERSQVEQALKEDAEFRDVCDELRELRDRFGALPRYKLGKTLVDRVMRRAERAMLTSSAGGAPASGPPDKEVELASSLRAGDRTRIVRRGVWAVAAIAAAVLVAVVATQTPETEVAQQPAPSAPLTAPQPSEPTLGERVVKKELGDKEQAAVEQQGKALYVRRGGSVRGGAVVEGEAAPAPKAGRLAGKLAANGDDDRPKYGRSPKQIEKGARPVRPQKAAPSSEGRHGEPRPAQLSELIAHLKSTGAPVICMNATHAAVEEKRFDKTLLANRIRFRPAARPTAGLSALPAVEAALPAIDAPQQPPAPEKAEVKVVLVEAPRERIANVLADLLKQPSGFPLVLDANTGQDARHLLRTLAHAKDAQVDAMGARGQTKTPRLRHVAPGSALSNNAAGPPAGAAAPSALGDEEAQERQSLEFSRREGLVERRASSTERKDASEPRDSEKTSALSQDPEDAAGSAREFTGVARRIPTLSLRRAASEPKPQPAKGGDAKAAVTAPDRRYEPHAISVYFVIRVDETAGAAAETEADGSSQPIPR